MANLVQPVSPLEPVEERIIEFRGLNQKDYIEEGELSGMKNLTADNYPLLKPRRPRGHYAIPEGVKRPLQLITRYGVIGMVAVDDDDEVSFFLNGQKVTGTGLDNLNVSTKAVAINTKICFFPQKTYVKVIKEDGRVVTDGTGFLEETYTATGQDVVTIQATTEDTRVTLNADHNFQPDDVIKFEGTLSYGSTSLDCETSVAIENVNGRTLYLPFNTFAITGTTSGSFSGTISRTTPDLDHVIEWNNRLWGVNNADNTIYACKLGDPTNWEYYQGTSMDSYSAQQGTDEEFTGVAEYSGHLIFFKPNNMCRIYGTAPSNYQITNTDCYGLEDESRLSVVTINDTVFYKSSIGIMAYSGGLPYCISEKFNRSFKNVVAGTEGTKYYASCLVDEEGSGSSQLMVFDIDKGLWHKEDSTRYKSCCTMDNRLYYICSDEDAKVCSEDEFCNTYNMVGDESTEAEIGVVNSYKRTEYKSGIVWDEKYEDIKWQATFGPFDEYIEEHKISSKLALRFKADGPSSADVYISIDEADWEKVQHYDSISTQGEFIPIVPRRCDRFSVKIEGQGEVSIKSLTRRIRRGTFGRL